MWLRIISTLAVTTMRCVKLLAGGNGPPDSGAKRVYTSGLTSLAIFKSYRKEVFMDMVAKAKKLIREGDMFQCVLSQRFSADFEGYPLDYYRNLRVTNPSNYLYFYDLEIIR